jgi:hypothetical protein
MINGKEDEHVRPSERGSVAVLSRHRQAPIGEAMTISIAPISPHVAPRTWAERQRDEYGNLVNVNIPVVSLESIDPARYKARTDEYTLPR